MPNWCYNELTITGPVQDISEFKEKAKNLEPSRGNYRTYLSLNEIVKRPKSEEENWYQWNIANWGTKWDVNAECPDFSGNMDDDNTAQLLYYFDSAWSPPDIFIKKAALIHPSLEFVLSYREPGMGFQGTITAKNDYYTNVDEEFEPDEDEEDEELDDNDNEDNNEENNKSLFAN